MARPLRSCIGCRRVSSPEDLVRVVRTEDGSLRVGRSLPGRGAWLCAGAPACFELAVRRKAFERAFKAPVGAGATESLRANLTERARIDGRDM
ncbi:MAG: YlxR family protein [Actinobacteria bacterium]|nr:YlxR family protein [Actinomycetota bacterium]MBW3651613.1 YlxR family protein [Actinomycetota bacterium]